MNISDYPTALDEFDPMARGRSLQGRYDAFGFTSNHFCLRTRIKRCCGENALFALDKFFCLMLDHGSEGVYS